MALRDTNADTIISVKKIRERARSQGTVKIRVHYVPNKELMLACADHCRLYGYTFTEKTNQKNVFKFLVQVHTLIFLSPVSSNHLF